MGGTTYEIITAAIRLKPPYTQQVISFKSDRLLMLKLIFKILYDTLDRYTVKLFIQIHDLKKVVLGSSVLMIVCHHSNR